MGVYSMIRHDSAQFEAHRGDVHTVDGPEDLLAMYGASRDAGKASAWMGGDSAQAVYSRATYGMDTFVPETEELIAQIEAKLSVQTSGYIIDNAIVGFTPDVPSALCGIPESMISMESTMLDNAPVTVWVNTTMSGGIDTHTVARRGAGIAALVMRLQMLRPVTLKVVVGLDGRGGNQFMVCPINARPLSLAQVSYIMCHAGFTRHSYDLLREWGGSRGGWDGIFIANGRQAWGRNEANLARETLGFLGGDLEHDVYIPQLMYGDPLARDPVEWVTRVIGHYMKDQA